VVDVKMASRNVPSVVREAIAQAEGTEPHRVGRAYYKATPDARAASSSPDHGPYLVFTRYGSPIVDPEWESSKAAQKVWSVVDKCVFFEDALVARHVDAYFTWQAADGCLSDLCLYCGADNGVNGEFRSGWDCCHCGGN